jgi:collagenase-like PrtC family protease
MIEILAPAGNTDSLKAALNAGADSVYLGLDSFSARRNAKNFSVEELHEAARICRLSGVKLYLTLNTLVFDRELPQLRKAVQISAEAGIDAFIIQDPAVLQITKETAPNAKHHASTQMTITSVSGAEAARKLGFSRVVLARELSLSEITNITRSVEIETEVFIHGALCVSISGQCHMSAFFGGDKEVRSANRGLCAQPCRLNFKAGSTDFALSLKDLSIIKYIRELEKAGVTSEVSHRPYTTGFYIPAGEPDPHVYHGGYIRGCDFIAMVTGYDPATGIAVIEQRNKFVVGDEIEIVRASGGNFRQTVGFLTDTKGNLLQEAPHPQQRLKIKLEQPVNELDMLRKCVKE